MASSFRFFLLLWSICRVGGNVHRRVMVSSGLRVEWILSFISSIEFIFDKNIIIFTFINKGVELTWDVRRSGMWWWNRLRRRKIQYTAIFTLGIRQRDQRWMYVGGSVCWRWVYTAEVWHYRIPRKVWHVLSFGVWIMLAVPIWQFAIHKKWRS